MPVRERDNGQKKCHLGHALVWEVDGDFIEDFNKVIYFQLGVMCDSFSQLCVVLPLKKLEVWV